MNLDELADFLARRCVVTHCNAYYVCVTQHQQEKVIADCTAQIKEVLAKELPLKE